MKILFLDIDGVLNSIDNDYALCTLWEINKQNKSRDEFGVLFDTFTMWDWYYALNMIYSDYVVVIGNTPSTYISLAKAWMNDKDAGLGKAYRYYMMIMDK